MPANVWILNLVVLGAVLEADLGRRKIGWIRVLRPLLTAVLICPLFLDSIPTDSHDLALQAAGIGAGVLLGLVAHLFISVGYGSVKGRRGTRDRAVSRTGFGYAAFWTVVYGGRLLFIYGTLHWFSVPTPGPAGEQRPGCPDVDGLAARRAGGPAGPSAGTGGRDGGSLPGRPGQPQHCCHSAAHRGRRPGR